MKLEVIRETLDILAQHKDIELRNICLRDLAGFKGVYEFIVDLGVGDGIEYRAHKIFIKNRSMAVPMAELRDEITDYIRRLEELYR